MAFNSDSARKAGSAPKRRDIITAQMLSALNEMAPERAVTKARAMAEMLIDKALAGDIAAAREVLDRVEGKPHQTTENWNHADPALLSDDDLASRITELLTGRVGAARTISDKTNGSGKPH